jgi:hypothetical protein
MHVQKLDDRRITHIYALQARAFHLSQAHNAIHAEPAGCARRRRNIRSNGVGAAVRSHLLGVFKSVLAGRRLRGSADPERRATPGSDRNGIFEPQTMRKDQARLKAVHSGTKKKPSLSRPARVSRSATPIGMIVFVIGGVGVCLVPQAGELGRRTSGQTRARRTRTPTRPGRPERDGRPETVLGERGRTS